MKLNKPQVAAPGNVANFVKAGDKKPTKSRLTARAFKFQQVFIDLIDSEAEKTCHDKVEVLKAALAAFSAMTEEEKNHWLLHQRRM